MTEHSLAYQRLNLAITGNVEVKGLFRGQKFLKNYCIAHGKHLSFFAGLNNFNFC